jgi:Stress responsive A/B Barrel Domain
MIKHIVMWRLKDHANGNDKATNKLLIKQKIEALNGKIPGMLKLEVGIDYSATDQSCDLALYSEFISQQALNDYLVHPDHKAAAVFIGEVRSERYLVDYEN